MQQAAIPGYKLSKARFSTRLLTTLGLVSLFLGLSSAALLSLAKTGTSAASVRAYYLGGDGDGGLESLLSTSSPRPFGELAEVTHLHLVGGGMLLFFLCHLLSVCELAERIRSALYIVAFTSFLASFGLPWLIIYASPVFAQAYVPSIFTLLTSLFCLTILPLREMWFKHRGDGI